MFGSLPPVPGYDASMPSGIDHVVIAVADPDASAAELTEKVGLAFTAGGCHEGLGTFNRIAFLGDAYLELMGVEDAAAAQGLPRPNIDSQQRAVEVTFYAKIDARGRADATTYALRHLS